MPSLWLRERPRCTTATQPVTLAVFDCLEKRVSLPSALLREWILSSRYPAFATHSSARQFTGRVEEEATTPAHIYRDYLQYAPDRQCRVLFLVLSGCRDHPHPTVPTIARRKGSFRLPSPPAVGAQTHDSSIRTEREALEIPINYKCLPPLHPMHPSLCPRYRMDFVVV